MPDVADPSPTGPAAPRDAGSAPPSLAAAASLIFEQGQDLFLLTDWETTEILDVNPAWERVLGWRRGELVGRPAIELAHPDDLVALARSRSVLEAERSSRLTFRVRGRTGRWRWIDGVAHRVGDQQIMGVLRDVTDARERELDLAGLVENAPFASCIIAPDYSYITMSETWRTMFDIALDAPLAEAQLGVAQAPATRRRLGVSVGRALAGEVVERKEDHLVTLTGRPLIVRWRMSPWRRGDAVAGVMVYATDVSDFVRARRTTRAAAKRLRLALDAASAAVFEIDYAERRFWAGPGFGRLAGRAPAFEEAVGLWPNIHPEDRERVRQEIGAFDSKRPLPIEARMITADGTLWTRCHLRIQHDGLGRPLRAVGLIQDIDAHKRQEIALETAERRANVAADAKSNFLANISHEIRTPMNGVLGVLQLIKREHLDSDELMLLDEALASGRMLTEMLDDLLDFSKIETGQFALHPEPLDPTAVLVGVASLLEPAASAKGLTMRAVAAPDLGLVKADPLRLRQALYNLMGNAVKFTPQGSIEARLTRRVHEDGHERLRFEIQDTGVGVPEAAQATLFERFEQADGSATRRYGGSGLGLAITRRLAEMMGGAVGFTSRPGEGSTFWIEIDGRTCEPAPAPLADDADIGAFKVLLVEDNPTNRLVISKILEALGVAVDTAEDGAEGVALASRGGYDLVLMDIQMPGMDGLEATRRIRALEGPRSAIPIVAVTANVLAEQRSSYADAGMDGVVAKPVSAGALMAEIARVAERSALH